MIAEIIPFPMEISKARELENCVSCNEQTDIRRDEPIDLRPNYVKGMGQMCGGCYGGKIINTKQFAEALDKLRYD